MGGVLPQRRAAEASHSRAPPRRVGDGASAIPEWLFEECYDAVGDLAETISLLLPDARARRATGRCTSGSRSACSPLARAVARTTQRDSDSSRAWRELAGTERFVWNKLITGGFRVGVSQQLVVRALSRASGIDEGRDRASPERARGSRRAESFDGARRASRRPTPTSRSPIRSIWRTRSRTSSRRSATPAEWQVEWKWDGIRAQVIRRDGRTFIWSRGEELVTDRFPEIAAAAELLPDGTVLDGEIMPWHDGTAAAVRAAAAPHRPQDARREDPRARCRWCSSCTTCSSSDGATCASEPLAWRRARLDELLGDGARRQRSFRRRIVALATWDDAARGACVDAREMCAEGLMLKRLDGAYGVGRRKGGWWKWKVQPYAVDAVMIYAQAGHGRRASLHTDYTFAVWDGGTLVPFAKAYSGLTDAEIRELDAWIRRNTVEKFGPVRSVKPEQVFELAFEGIQPSPATSRASPFGFRASCAGARTRSRRTPTRSRRCTH